MSGDQYESAMEGFIAELNMALQAAGGPTYAELERVSERLRARGGADRVDVLTRSTTNEILNGRRLRPPRWQRVQSLLIVLRTIARNSGIPIEPIGTDTAWKRRHEAVSAAEAEARRSVSVGRHRKSAGPLSGTMQRSAPGRPDADLSGTPGTAFAPHPRAGGSRWLHQYRDIAPESLDAYSHLESAAKVVRTYEPQVFPSLLQAEAYAREIVRHCCPSADDGEISRLVGLRLQRQARLGDPCFQLWAIIGETMLRNPGVAVQTMRTQIAHLINVCEQANVSVQVLRTSQENDDHVTIQEPITQFRFPEEHRDDIVFLERSTCGVILTDRKEIAHYGRMLSRLGIRAASTEDTQLLLREVFTEL